MAKIIDFNGTRKDNSLNPIENWDGDSWRCFFENVCVPMAEEEGYDPWDIFAVIMQGVLSDK